jgi:hypothetical protein
MFVYKTEQFIKALIIHVIKNTTPPKLEDTSLSYIICIFFSCKQSEAYEC